MIISEKGMVAAMTAAAKKGGYRIRFDPYRDELWVMTDDWLVCVDWSQTPRKVLGLIAEHFGYLPMDDEGGCFKVEKAGADGIETQTYLLDAFSQDAQFLISGEREAAMYTGISVWGMDLYVSRAGRLRGVKPTLFSLLDAEQKTQMAEGRGLLFSDEDGFAVLAVRDGSQLSEAQQVLWESLESIDWWHTAEGGGEAALTEAGELPEQVSFDEAVDPPAGDEDYGQEADYGD